MEKSAFESPELQAKLKTCDPEIQQYLIALKAENSRLQKKIVKLEAKNVSLNHRVLAFEQNLKKQKHFDLPSMSHEEKEKLGIALVRELVKRAGGWDEFNKKYPENS